VVIGSVKAVKPESADVGRKDVLGEKKKTLTRQEKSL
jgi:hypothetical protein